MSASMDTLGIEPRASRMLSGCDTTTPHALDMKLGQLCLVNILLDLAAASPGPFTVCDPVDTALMHLIKQENVVQWVGALSGAIHICSPDDEF